VVKVSQPASDTQDALFIALALAPVAIMASALNRPWKTLPSGITPTTPMIDG
jgi:hypothetical protein